MTLQEYFDQTIQGHQPSAQHLDPLFVHGMFRNFDLNKNLGKDWVTSTKRWGKHNGLNVAVLDGVS